MKQTTFKNAVTMVETLITLSLIGILAVTMIALNDFSGNNARIATQKLAQTDSALQSWSRAITASNETGVGATTFASAADPTEAIAESIKDYLANNQSETKLGLVADNVTYNGEYESITLSNDVTVNVKFTANKDSLDSMGNNLALSNIAVITASVKENKNDKTPVTEEYALKASGLQSLSSVFEGWEKYKIETVTIDGTDKRMYCAGKTECADGCAKASEYCTVTEAEGEYIYVKEDSRTACGSGQNGSIVTQQIGSISGVFEATIDMCCPNPKEYVSGTGTSKVCACPESFVAQDGYEKNDASATCQSACQPGKYESNHICVLCDKNNYCPAEKMTAPTKCAAGYYCPNDKTKKVDDKYHKDKYTLDDNNNVTAVADGGLKDKVICPKGYYCPTDNMDEPTRCPKGYYCPTDGLTKPTPCPAGTYGYAEGATSQTSGCKDCPDGEYQDQVGQTSCKTCEGILSADKKSCTICQAGTYLSEGKCVACPKGHKCPTAGMTEPTPCPCGQYQTQTGKTECYDIPVGAYPTKGGKYVTTEAVDVTVCPKGYQCAGACHNKVACAAGHYQDRTGQNFCKECTCGTYQDKTAQISCKNVPAGKYPTKDGNASLGTAATSVGTCPAGSYCVGKCNLSKHCTGNTYSYAGSSYCTSCPTVSWSWFCSGRTHANTMHTSCNCPSTTCWMSGGFNGAVGITLTGGGFSCPATLIVYNSDPVIFDLKDNGIKLTSAEDGVIFDIKADGKPIKTAWTDVQTEFDDAFLCQDLNENGNIDDGSELFGDQNGAENGMLELAKYDDNKDGVINKDDAIYNKLLLWVDFNKDGVTDEGELRLLKDEMISEISTSYTIEKDENGDVKTDEYGNEVGIKSTFKKILEDGSEFIGKIIDVFFKVIDAVTEALS